MARPTDINVERTVNPSSPRVSTTKSVTCSGVRRLATFTRCARSAPTNAARDSRSAAVPPRCAANNATTSA
ncbi:Uncharacterised protein [Mycobacteroides abscessus subsp. abscessus]|nr:Uncharacterised protein [Mycobacteroides abscessus subsp. abscessus]